MKSLENGFAKLKGLPVKKATSLDPDVIKGNKPEIVLNGQSKEKATMSGISNEKLEWLESIGAQHFDPPIEMSWCIDDFTEAYSNEFISKTPLDELKTIYESDHKSYLRKLQENNTAIGKSRAI